MSVFRIYSEKKEPYSVEAKALCHELKTLLGINALEGVRILNRYDVQGIDEPLFEKCRSTVFSEPQLDVTYDKMPRGDFAVLAVEYLPGQFDQRAESAAECIQLISAGERPVVRSAKIYLLSGALCESDLAKIEKYVINPVEARKASLERKTTLETLCDIPTSVATLEGFTKLDEKGLADFVESYALAMDADDAAFCRDYFAREYRDPTISEIRMIDTYWSDHCRHTTFGTIIDDVSITDNDLVAKAYDEYLSVRSKLGRSKPICLMDMATIAAKYLKMTGELKNLDESDEINACSVRIKVDNNGTDEDWLLLFKNETHNHPTEIEPFGGAATCIGGAIRDPLANRGYVYQAMRVTGAGNPLVPVSETLEGKLPQRKLVTTAAAGYSSYGNQIGLATGAVNEIYHEGYIAKRMEIGAVVGAVRESSVRREEPKPGDVVILLGGRTGRDGCGGATGSSKAHKLESLERCGAEVQKGNAPVERKLQRLFRDERATLLIKRCNDFGAGGVSVAIGELADGLCIDLDAVPKKYDGLDGTELAISESQERMAVVVAAKDEKAFIALANGENLEATKVAVVTESPRLVMNWCGNKICDISREFLNSNGAPKHITVSVGASGQYKNVQSGTFCERLEKLETDINFCSQKGLSERFDSTIGAATVLMPFGGKNQLTPAQAMAAKLPVSAETKTCSGMAWGFDPYVSESSEYKGAYLAVCESISKLVASGFKKENTYLTFQEYFKRLGNDPKRWGSPFSALLGALKAQLDYKTAAIGGKDSMSGSFENIDVPPTLVSFAVASGCTDDVISPEFKKSGSRVALFCPEYDDTLLPNAASQNELFEKLEELIKQKRVLSVWAVGRGGIADGVFKMCLGNSVGFRFESAQSLDGLFCARYGSFIAELANGCDEGETLGYTTDCDSVEYAGESVCLSELRDKYEGVLEPVFPYRGEKRGRIEAVQSTERCAVSPKIGVARPRVLIPVFPGTNCEYDSARAMTLAGAQPSVFVINNLSAAAVAQSVESIVKLIDESQMIFLPGGFSGGDEPEGSAKFITALFRAPAVSDAVMRLLNERDGLMLGICNGFQALLKLGLLPFGRITETDASCPTLTFNEIGRHQSMLVRTRVCCKKSPWLCECSTDEIYTVAVSHGEGRFVASDAMLNTLAASSQIATQYVDLSGVPTEDVRFNPNGSALAIEGITSPDGRIFGKMGHSERTGDNVYKNVCGNKYQPIFTGGVNYFKV